MNVLSKTEVMTTKQTVATNCGQDFVEASQKQWKFIQMEQLQEIVQEESRKKMLRQMAFGKPSLRVPTVVAGPCKRKEISESTNGADESTTEQQLVFLTHRCGKCNAQILYSKGAVTIRCSGCSTIHSTEDLAVNNSSFNEDTLEYSSKRQKVDSKKTKIAELVPVRRSQLRKLAC